MLFDIYAWYLVTDGPLFKAYGANIAPVFMDFRVINASQPQPFVYQFAFATHFVKTGVNHFTWGSSYNNKYPEQVMKLILNIKDIE